MVSYKLANNAGELKYYLAPKITEEEWKMLWIFVYLNEYMNKFENICLIDQNSKVDGSGFGTFKLFLNKNSANLSTGSLGNYFKI